VIDFKEFMENINLDYQSSLYHITSK